jgi:hypothetical protein
MQIQGSGRDRTSKLLSLAQKMVELMIEKYFENMAKFHISIEIYAIKIDITDTTAK